MPETGALKKFKNGNIGRWDGEGWELVRAAQPAQAPQPKRGLNDTVTDMATGAAKGLSETSSNLVGLIPGVRTATRAVGNYLGGKAGEAIYGTTAEPVTREQADASLEPVNTAERVGKGAEQIAEFLVPAKAASLGAVEGLVKLIPNASKAATMAKLNKAAAIAGRTIGEAGSAGTVSMLHGDEHPERAAMTAGAGPLVGQAAGAVASTLKYPLTRKMVAIIAGAGGASALGGVTPAGLGAGFGAYSLTRSVADKVLKNPAVIKKIQNAASSGSREAARLLASIYSVVSDDAEAEAK